MARLDVRSRAAESLAGELSEAVKHNRAAHQVLERLLALEVRRREERRIKTSLRLSGLPLGMTLGEFDFGFQPSIERRQIETLAGELLPTGYTARVTGSMYLLSKASLAVAVGTARSLSLALVVVFGIILVLFRSLRIAGWRVIVVVLSVLVSCPLQRIARHIQCSVWTGPRRI